MLLRQRSEFRGRLTGAVMLSVGTAILTGVVLAQGGGLTFWETVWAAAIPALGVSTLLALAGWWIHSARFPRREPLEIKAYPNVHAHGAAAMDNVLLYVGRKSIVVVGVRARRFIPRLDEINVRFAPGIARTVSTDDIPAGTIKIQNVVEGERRGIESAADRDGYRITYSPPVRLARGLMLWLEIEVLAHKEWNGYLSIRFTDEYGTPRRMNGPIIDAKTHPQTPPQSPTRASHE